ncbi:MAG: hypothetical protein HY730_09345 [Candidatus Tectomicrobia bacterium]|uniref:Uncharacterized protein n=1 Tax=Tectimicrobiota bacterium TaxID=2528274 RepID=A0A933GNV6_UNCTE|nr:hypothetical protein [Candidatus Tectomicrobia bacterium]
MKTVFCPELRCIYYFITGDGGMFESVAVILHPNGDRDQVWVVVNRYVNGSYKRYIEYLDDVNGYYSSLGMDSALTYSGAPTAVLTGLNHLEGTNCPDSHLRLTAPRPGDIGWPGNIGL